MRVAKETNPGGGGPPSITISTEKTELGGVTMLGGGVEKGLLEHNLRPLLEFGISGVL